MRDMQVWRREAERFTPNLTVRVLDRTAAPVATFTDPPRTPDPDRTVADLYHGPGEPRE